MPSKYKNVDQLVDEVRQIFRIMMGTTYTDEDVCDAIMNNPDELLNILLSESNIPSKYDIAIIQSASKFSGTHLIAQQILEIYKKRKE